MPKKFYNIGHTGQYYLSQRGTSPNMSSFDLYFAACTGPQKAGSCVRYTSMFLIDLKQPSLLRADSRRRQQNIDGNSCNSVKLKDLVNPIASS
jgi:hypothetical protein